MLENSMLLPEPNYWMPPVNVVMLDLSDLEPATKDFNKELLVQFRKDRGLNGTLE